MISGNWFLDYWDFISYRYPDILTALKEHMVISGTSVFFGCVAAIPLGIYLAGTHVKWIRNVSFTMTNIFQTIPSLALLAMLLPIFGIGMTPAIVALFLYSLLPILRNTFAGFQSVDLGVLESARGMGFSAVQRLFLIQLPLAFPYIMSGIRVTSVYIISWTTLATLIGAGGLGDLIFAGLAVNKSELIVTGSIAAILLALFADFILARVESMITHKVRAKQVSAI